jgi:hypothetical protein
VVDNDRVVTLIMTFSTPASLSAMALIMGVSAAQQMRVGQINFRPSFVQCRLVSGESGETVTFAVASFAGRQWQLH